MQSSAAKPLDLGSGRVCASFDLTSAAWLSVGAPHAEHGFVELSGVPPFDESGRGDPAATRRHRLAMTLRDNAFLFVTVDGDPARLEPIDTDAVAPHWTAPGIDCRATTAPGDTVIRQSWLFEAARGRHPTVVLRLRGRIDRPALAEITELDPPDPTGATTVWDVAGPIVRARSPELPASFAIAVEGAAVAWQPNADEVVGTISWPKDDDRLAFTIAVALAASGRIDVPPAEDGPREPERLTRRAVTYVRGCSALELGPGERTILTDHRILPLSWTRDAYWQALALLAADGPGDRQRVADHLRWLWRRCERPDGRWMRSHHANGRRKDMAFQADQQLYPLVELADYWRLTGIVPAGVAWAIEVPRAWSAALEARDRVTGLIASDENAADDPAAAPFIAASQILLWYAAARLVEIVDAGALELDAAALRAVATEVRASFERWIASDHGHPWPSAVDGAERRVADHDANDLPIALAPLWGFCRADDPGWNATMAFALSPANPSWVEGTRAGLGSAHTPGAWTLGIIQAWIRARTIGDDNAARAAQRQLEEVAFVDGMLPEAYDPDGDARVRHWFAWPGAAFAALRLLDRSGRLRERLTAGSIR